MTRKAGKKRPPTTTKHPTKSPGPAGDLLQSTWFWVVAMLLFFIIFFWRVIGNAWVLSPPYQDIYRISYPYMMFLDRAVNSGYLPLWNPFQFSGHPFVSNGEAGIYYLPKLLICLLFSGTKLMGWHALLHAWLGWITMFLLLGEFKRTLPTRVLGAFAWVFSGMGITLLPWVAFTASTMIWYPLAILILKRVPKTGWLSSTALLGICTTMQFTAGMAAYIVPFAMIMAAYGVYLLLTNRERQQRLNIALTLVGGAILGVLISSIHLLPTFEMTKISQRWIEATAGKENPASDWASVWSRFPPGVSLGHFFFPAGTADNLIRDIPYVALPILFGGIFVIVQCFRRKRTGQNPHDPDTCFWGIAALVGYVMIFENPLRSLVIHWFPLLESAHIITKGNMFYTLGMVIAGTMALESEALKHWKWQWLAGLAAIGVVLYIAYWGNAITKFPVELRTWHLIRFLLAAGLFLGLWWLWTADKITRNRFLWLTALIVAIAGAAAGWKYLFTGNMSLPTIGYYQPNQFTNRLNQEARTEYFRVLPIKVNLYPNSETVYQLYGLNGYCPMHWYRYSEFMAATEKDGDPYLRPGFLQHIALDSPKPELLALLNTKYIITREGLTKVPNYYPRAWLSNAYEVVSDPAERLERLKLCQFSKDSIMLEEDPRIHDWLGSNSKGEVRFTKYGANRLELSVDASSNNLLTLSEINFPGWIAKIDGKRVPIWTSYHILRTIAVPEGRHTIIFDYCPSSFRIGRILTIVGVLCLLALVVVSRVVPSRHKPVIIKKSTF
jgi:hypothetical protein